MMETFQEDVQLRAIELSIEAFETFCSALSDMLSVHIEFSRGQFCVETVERLKERFEKLAAVDSVKCEGALNGIFQLVFDKDGLFTLSGVLFTLSEQEILDNRRHGSVKEAEAMSDAVREAGIMLASSWDRVFHAKLGSHVHFVQPDTFTGNVWPNAGDKTGLAGEEELVFVPLEMRIGSYPAFNCGVVFPRTIFADIPAGDGATAIADGEGKQEKSGEESQEHEPVGGRVDIDKSDAAQESDGHESESKGADGEKASAEGVTVEESAGLADTEAAETQQEPARTDEQPPVEMVGDAGEEAAQETPELHHDEVEGGTDDTNVPDNAIEEGAVQTAKSAETVESGIGDASEAVQRRTQLPVGLPGERSEISLAMCARDVMRTEVVWVSPDDSVKQVREKLELGNSCYGMIGGNGVLEAIVSKSDIEAATSPYLRPVFAKWRRPLDDATLQIRVKWIMNKPVSTVSPETSLAAILEDMSRLGLHCLPVVDQQGKMQGVVTTFDVFKALLKSQPSVGNIFAVEQASQTTALV